MYDILDPISVPVRHLADGGILYRHALTCERMAKEEYYNSKSKHGIFIALLIEIFKLYCFINFQGQNFTMAGV